MTNSLKYANEALLMCNNALSLNCCDTEMLYWDVIPCSLNTPYRTNCTEAEQCLYNERLYISPFAGCAGDEIKVCECQRLRIKNFSHIQEGILNESVTITYSPSAPGTGFINWTNNEVFITDTNGDNYSIPTTGTLQNIIDFIESLPSWSAGPGGDSLDFQVYGYVVATGITVFEDSSPINFLTKSSSFTLRVGSNISETIVFDSDVNILANNIEYGLNAIPGYSGFLDVTPNTNYLHLSDDKYFEITFKDTMCGVAQSGFDIERNYLLYDGSYTADSVTGYFGNFSYNKWYDQNDYTRLGSGTFSDHPTEYSWRCPYNQLQGTNNLGPYPYNGIQCCPQKGVTIGPTQQLFSMSDGMSGYVYSEDERRFANLENTVVINNQCYYIDPFFFLFGIGGRFQYNRFLTREPYLTSECNYNKHPQSGGCISQLPCNCAFELFLPLFHKNVPWGVFGSYYPGIEEDSHPATDTDRYPGSYIGSNYPDRIGWDYKPQGTIKTRGTWIETKEIELYCVFHRPAPFYVGTDVFDEINLLGQIDPSSVDSNFVGNLGNGCGPISLVYNASGKTVGDFVDAVNSLRSLDAEGVNGTGCPIFSFCISSDDVRNFPLSKVINVSSEMFDLAVQNNYTYNASLGAANPDIDADLFSGSDILVGPHKYDDMWPSRNTENLTKNITKMYNEEPFGKTNPRVKPPPYCRHRYYELPNQPAPFTQLFKKLSPAEDFTDFGLNTPWWRSIEGCVENILTFSAGSGIPSFVTRIDVGVSGRNINISVSSGSVIAYSGSINTNKNGSGYTVIDCYNQVKNTGITLGGQVFWPVNASTGYFPYDIWLDDGTYWDGSNNPVNIGDPAATPTTMNWGYVEPIYDAVSKNLLMDGDLECKTFVRRRCNYGNVVLQENNLYPLTGCVPISATRYDSSSRLDCDSDTIRTGDFITIFGCSSHVCRTEWFLKTSRCGCSDEYSCNYGSNNGRGFIKHKYNQEGNDDNKIAYGGDCISVTQPTLYICEYNFHPDCDIPMMVKVPFQVWGEKTCFPTNPNGLGFECGQSDLAIVYINGQGTEQASDQYLGRVTCYSEGILSLTYGDPTYPFESECVGWCQYIDPVSALRVKKEDIPKTWPPSAYIVNRGTNIFCSVNPYSETITDICNGIFPSYNWDVIVNILPVVPPDYYLNYDIVPCMMTPYGGGLIAYTRPVINPFTYDDLCGFGGQTRIDINCATKCCGCEFRCDSDTGLKTEGPYRPPCFVDYAYEETGTITNAVVFCSVMSDLTSFNSPCNHGCLLQGDADVIIPDQIGGTYDAGYSLNFNYHLNTTCGCDESTFGSPTKTYTLTSSVNCEGFDNEFYSYYDNCLGTSRCGGEGVEYYFCCGGGNNQCAPDPDSVLSCADFNTLIQAKVDENVTSTSYNRNLFGFCTTNCDFTTIRQVISSSNECGQLSQTWNYQGINVCEGTSSLDGAELGYDTHGGGIEFENTDESQVEGSLTVSEETCSACPVGQQDSKSFTYINTWLENINYYCGYSNLLRSAGTGVYNNLCS